MIVGGTSSICFELVSGGGSGALSGAASPDAGAVRGGGDGIRGPEEDSSEILGEARARALMTTTGLGAGMKKSAKSWKAN